MKARVLESTDGFQWCKTYLAQYEPEDARYVSTVSHTPLLQESSVPVNGLWVLDLQTSEGLYVPLDYSGSAKGLLAGHRIWVCPLFEVTLQAIMVSAAPFELPALLELPLQAKSFLGHRRAGPEATSLYYIPDAILCTDHLKEVFREMRPPYFKRETFSKEGDIFEKLSVKVDVISQRLLGHSCAMCRRPAILGRSCVTCSTPLHAQWPFAFCCRECSVVVKG